MKTTRFAAALLALAGLVLWGCQDLTRVVEGVADSVAENSPEGSMERKIA